MKKALAVCLSLLLGGCATAPQVGTITATTKRQYSKGLLPAFDETQVTANIRQAVKDVSDDEADFSNKIDRYRGVQTSFDSSVILLSIGAVAAALYKSSTAALGGIGIVTNGAVAYRSYYDPEAEGAAYIKATDDLRCLVTHGSALQVAQPEGLLTQVATLQIAMNKVVTTSALLNASSTSATLTQQAKDDGGDAAAKALDAARNAQAALQAEIQAYNLGPATITQGHNAVLNFIALKRHRAYVDAGATKTAINAAVASSASADAQKQVTNAKLDDANKALGKAQSSSNENTSAPIEQPDTTPITTTAALTAAPKTEIPAGKTPAATNTRQVAALVRATSNALMAMPPPKFTQIITDLTVCTANL
jgi:hypothetical protein